MGYTLRHLTLLLISLLLLSSCGQPKTLLEQIKKDGVLLVATRNSPTTYFEGPDGPTGFEYDLISLLAKELKVKVKIITPSNLSDILSLVSQNQVHLAAAGLTVTESRQQWIRFGPPYQTITQQLVYRMGSERKRPRKLADLIGKHIEVVADSSHAEQLEELQASQPELEWIENPELDSGELLNLVWEQVIDYSIADSNEVNLSQRFYPELNSAFDISKPQQLAWAFPIDKDDSLYNAAAAFIKKIKENGELDILLDRYYGHIERFNFSGTRTYLRHIHKRLPKYRELFEAAAKKNDLDWRLLAAIGYQESHWNPDARSPTGVRGIMMLTLATAEYLKIKDRLDPTQSIEGGSRYIKKLTKRIPEDIKEPDRTWFALAAYNVGLGHLEDARIITEKRGGNPDAWNDVKENLPLLSSRKWYKQTKHGYARGREPVRYVEYIRSYYDLLVWYSAQLDERVTSEPDETGNNNEAVEITSPAL